MTLSFFLYDNKPNTDPVYTGISWLLKHLESQNRYVALSTLGSLEAYSERKGLEVLNKLKKTPHSDLINNLKFTLIYESKIPHNLYNCPILVLHADKKYLDKLCSIKNISEMFVIGYPEDMGSWINYSNASEYGKSQKNIGSASLSNVVKNALVSVTSTINIANGMTHPRNKDWIISTFQVLADNKESFDPEDVKAWLISNGKWDPEDAELAKEIVAGIKAGKKYRLWMPDHRWIDDIIEHWRNKE